MERSPLSSVLTPTYPDLRGPESGVLASSSVWVSAGVEGGLRTGLLLVFVVVAAVEAGGVNVAGRTLISLASGLDSGSGGLRGGLKFRFGTLVGWMEDGGLPVREDVAAETSQR